MSVILEAKHISKNFGLTQALLTKQQLPCLNEEGISFTRLLRT